MVNSRIQPTFEYAKIKSSMRTFTWEGICNEAPETAIQSIESIINKHGYILNFQSFAGPSLDYTFGVEEARAKFLFDELKKGFELSGDFPVSESGKIECMVYLNIRFPLRQNDDENDVYEAQG